MYIGKVKILSVQHNALKDLHGHSLKIFYVFLISLFYLQCPFCHQSDPIIIDSVTDKNFCIENVDNGTLQLKQNHPYYYQVPTGHRFEQFVVLLN